MTGLQHALGREWTWKGFLCHNLFSGWGCKCIHVCNKSLHSIIYFYVPTILNSNNKHSHVRDRADEGETETQIDFQRGEGERLSPSLSAS